ncbi:NEL-type E3 ubiquitin ligase domain-containing protein [Paraburkholderia agricolaris]|uniref:NEL-type E3 ubiquitin ligase domain-containing protein n=1 Tax=Paraburkholderia agricolaris TaxID=2152888 RepID=UPI0038B91E93
MDVEVPSNYARVTQAARGTAPTSSGLVSGHSSKRLSPRAGLLEKCSAFLDRILGRVSIQESKSVVPRIPLSECCAKIDQWAADLEVPDGEFRAPAAVLIKHALYSSDLELDLTPYGVLALPAEVAVALSGKRVLYGPILCGSASTPLTATLLRARFDAHIKAWVACSRAEICEQRAVAARRIGAFLDNPNTDVLDLRRLSLLSLPPQLGALDELCRQTGHKPLRQLVIYWNKLNVLPDSIGMLRDLEVLDASYNEITTVSESIVRLDKLRSVDLTRNGLKSLPGALCALPALTRLCLTQNGISALGDGIGQLATLQELDISDNPLADLSPGFGLLCALHTLNGSRTRIRSLPDTFVNLVSLRVLKLVDTPLESLPEQFGKLTALEQVDLSESNLAVVPESIGGLSKLRFLALNLNPLICLPSSIGELSESCLIYASPEHFVPEEKERLESNTGAGPRVRFGKPSDEQNGRTERGLQAALKMWLPALQAQSDEGKWRLFLDTPYWRDFAELLTRLKETAEARVPATRAQLATRVSNVVDALAVSATLRVTVFDIAREALGQCGDRVGYGLQMIEFAVLNAQAESGDLDTVALVTTGRQMCLQSELTRIVIEKLQTLSDKETVETYLGYQVRLRELGVDLPGGAPSMNHWATSGLTNEDIEIAGARLKALSLDGNEQMKVFLRDYGPLKAYVERVFKAELSEVDALFRDEGERLAVRPDEMSYAAYDKLARGYIERKERAWLDKRNELIDAVVADAKASAAEAATTASTGGGLND